MPKISDITKIINASLELDPFNTSRFQGSLYYDVADLVKEKQTINENVIDTTKPVLIDNAGDCTPVIIDDTVPMQIYHRILSLTYDTEPTEQYGDPYQRLRETAKMTMVVIADRNKIKMAGEDLIALAAIHIPATITNLQLLTLNLVSCQMYVEGDTIIDSEQIYEREYNTGEYLLPDKIIMYAISYTIVTVFDKKCFPNCVV